MGDQAGEQHVHKRLRSSSGITPCLFLKAQFVISGFCIPKDPAAGLNHCIPVRAAHRNRVGGNSYTSIARYIVFRKPGKNGFAKKGAFQNNNVPIVLEMQNQV